MDSDRIRVAHRRVDIRRTHPGLWRAMMAFAAMKVALAFNFWFFTPTFNPYNIPKDVIGCIFAVIGFSQLFFLNVYRDLRIVRAVFAFSTGFMFFWGIANTQQVIAGNASLQLPILYLGLCLVQLPWLIEAPVNPMTEREP